ncbi:MAG: protein kinase [Hyphomicrobiaceae bacterium]
MSVDASQRGPDLLPPGTVVGAYVIRSILGTGGFGVTYRAEHSGLGKEFALKEYFPRGYAQREGTTVSAFTNTGPTYRWGLDRFLQEARALAKFHHRAIVGVSNVFEANGTAYIVLSFEHGRDMRKWRAELGRPPSQAELDAVLVDLLDALAELHKIGLIHRDIAPDNIYIRADGSPVLLDFGAARHAVGEHSAQISAIVKSGYSPPEQYSTDSKAQGPWSDIYALGATLYAQVIGRAPPEAALRMLDDTFEPAAKMAPAGYRPEFLAGIDMALQLPPKQRPPSVDEWRASLLAIAPERPVGASGHAPASTCRVPVLPLHDAQDAFATTPSQVAHEGTSGWSRSTVGLAGIGLFCIVALAGIASMRPKQIGSDATTNVPTDAAAQCTLLAAIPLDRAGDGPGVHLENLDAAAATASCRRAISVASSAELPRMQAQFGQALRAQGNMPEATRALRLAANAGHAEAQALLGDFLYDGTPPLAPDRKAACDLYERAMQGGSAYGTSNYAFCIANGSGGRPRDERRASQLYRQAADAGSRDGMLLLGVAYRDGHGLPLSVNDAIRWVEKAAGLGEARAHYVLADLHHSGYGVPLDRKKATELYHLARAGLERMAARNHIDAISVLGSMHRDGDGMGSDPASAARLYQKASDLGSSHAMSNLADLYARGSGVTQDLQKAMTLLRTAVEREDTGAMVNLGMLHADGKGTAQDYDDAMRWYRRAAALGDGRAMEKIANMHFNGHGVKEDHVEAMRWFQLSADRGTASAMNSIGVLTENGQGVSKSPVEARRWYLRAADLGNADAMRNLGVLYEDGSGVKVDGREAERWFRRAVDRNEDVDAMHRLGELFRNGKTVTANPAEAIKWYRRAVEKDHAESMAALGILYEHGEGAPQNYTEAARLYRLSADKGSGTGMYLLASLYENGNGVEKDCAQARSWYQKSADAGDADAKKKIANGGLASCR